MGRSEGDTVSVTDLGCHEIVAVGREEEAAVDGARAHIDGAQRRVVAGGDASDGYESARGEIRATS